MTVLWLILKIILWLLGLLLALFLCILLGLLFLPIAYRISAEKYETIAYDVHLRIFYLISILYDSQTNNSIEVRLLGKTIKVIPISEEEEQDHHEVILQDVSEKAEASIKKQAFKTETSKKETLKTKVFQLERSQSESIKQEKVKKKVADDKKAVQSAPKHESRNERTDWMAYLKKLWYSQNREHFIGYCKILLRDWWRAIRPKVLVFNLIFGLEDPADTGMWLAKIMALYPFYAPYGNVMGNFEKPTLEGDIKLLGTTNLYRFIKPLIVFITHKQVRQYIKILMKIGKED